MERAGLSASPEPLQPRQVTVVLGRRPPPRTFRRPARLPEEVPAERRGFPRDPLALSSYAAAKALTLHITCLSSGEELLALLTRLLAPAGPAGSPPRLVPNAIHISAALSRLAKLEPASRWRDDPRTAGLVAAVGPLLPEVKPWSLVNMLWACAKLGIVPPWLDDWLVVSAPKLHEFVPQGLSNAIYSLGVLGVTRSRLPEPWLAAFWRASARVVTEGGKAGSPVERQCAFSSPPPRRDATAASQPPSLVLDLSSPAAPSQSTRSTTPTCCTAWLWPGCPPPRTGWPHCWATLKGGWATASPRR